MGEKEEKEAETKVEKNESFETRALIEKVVAYPSHRWQAFHPMVFQRALSIRP